MQVSHELPISLIELFSAHNDYEYCLPSFYIKYPEYKQHFLKFKRNGKFIIMDNGLFEGDSFSDEQLIELINELRPDIFVVPDEWNDSMATQRHAERWMTKIKPKLPQETQLMVVMQGKNLWEIVTVYENCVNMGYTHLSFNHSSEAYTNLFKQGNPLIAKMMGRLYVINHLRGKGSIKDDHYIHLLGCSLPQEFLHYPKEYTFIKSVDTSSPIICGLEGKNYYPWGLLDKPTNKMEVYINEPHLDADPTICSNILRNIRNFKGFVNQR